MKIQIRHRYTGATLFESESLSVSHAVVKAVQGDADLRADLRGAELRDADLRAELRGADLRNADLRNADLRGAYLHGAELRGAKGLEGIKGDLFAVLLAAPHEVAGLVDALKSGRVDGSAYEGDCACLVGTIANIRHCNYDKLPNLVPNASRPAERWFMAIREGDTPKTNPVVKLTLEWIGEFQSLISAALNGNSTGAGQ